MNNSYNQTKKILDNLKIKIGSAKSNQTKKIFVVVLEGTESEFDELKRLGAVEIENFNALSNNTSLLNSIKNMNIVDKDTNIGNSLVLNNTMNTSKYISSEAVVTEKDIAKLSDEIKEVLLKEKGIITPLAKDLAKKRGIKVTRAKP